MSSKQSTQISGLYKPNSIADARILRSQNSLSVSPLQKQKTLDSLPESTDFYTIYEAQASGEKPKQPLETLKKRPKMKKHVVKDIWNFSPQCKLLDTYQKRLQDCYPREPITCLPHRLAAPKYLAGHKNVPISAFSDPDAYMEERRVVFQPETILDAQTKVKYSESDVDIKPQVFLHLTDDMNSLMFQSECNISQNRSKLPQSEDIYFVSCNAI